MADENTKTELKSILDEARLEIAVAMQRIDSAGDVELASLAGAAQNLAAFVDFNSGCGGQREAVRSQLTAFVDFNDGCGGAAATRPDLSAAFVDFNSGCGSVQRASNVLRSIRNQ